MRNSFLFGNGLTQALQVIEQDREGPWNKGQGPDKKRLSWFRAEEQGCHRTGGLQGRRFLGLRWVWTKEAEGFQGSQRINAHALDGWERGS